MSCVSCHQIQNLCCCKIPGAWGNPGYFSDIFNFQYFQHIQVTFFLEAHAFDTKKYRIKKRFLKNLKEIFIRFGLGFESDT